MTITIYHNPDCGTSRNTLAMIRQSGEEPIIVEYLKTPPDRATIVRLIHDAGLTVRQALRQKNTPLTHWVWGIRERPTMHCWMPSVSTQSCSIVPSL